MSAAGDPAEAFLARVERVASRLREHASAPPHPGLTDPDPPTGERWEWGQVWAHLAEFVPYWTSQMQSIVESPSPDPVPFGRTRADPDRIAAIEHDRGVPPPDLWLRLQGQLGAFEAFLAAIPPEDWSKQGRHPTLGVMDMPRIVDEFVVRHLEAHAAQLDGLVAGEG